jgi:sugar phosphate isomerase/epimerase
MLAGLVSVTFRQLAPERIIELAKPAGLDCIEWGSDVHCPPGDFKTARAIAGLMASNGLTSVSYGTYYRTGTFEPFDKIIASAEILGAANIRVWAGAKPSAMASEEDWRLSAEDTRRIADMAAAHGMDVSFEYHCDTLTDSVQTTERLLALAERDNVFSYWQPPAGMSREENIYCLDRLIGLNKLKNLHVSFAGDTPTGAEWREYIKRASLHAGAALLEFVKDGAPDRLTQDAARLKAMMGGARDAV